MNTTTSQTAFRYKDASNNTDNKYKDLLDQVGVCQRLGYGSGCDCLNECSIIKQHLDNKEYPHGRP
jgi:hypothetical protein